MNEIKKEKARRGSFSSKIRKNEGKFQALYSRLFDDESKFFNYIRMNIGTLEEILSKIKQEKKITRSRCKNVNVFCSSTILFICMYN